MINLKIPYGYLVSILMSCLLVLNTQAQPFTWKVNNDGWVLSKNPDSNRYEKFFAIGTWHVPGYEFTNSQEPDEQKRQSNAALFKERTKPFNMFFVTPGYEKDYMSDKIHILNPFSPILHGYLDEVSELPDGNDKDYYRAQYIKQNVDSPEFEKYLDKKIEGVLEKLPNDKYIYSHIDELALGGVARWAVPPSVGAKINSRLKKQDREALVFVDLVGHCKGSTYFFEQRYLKNHDSLPENPPYELVDPEARNCKIPLLGFYEAHNGSPVYQFDDGKYSYTNYDFETLKSIWYENAKLLAGDYKESGDVFGINAFLDFSNYPVLTGVTVDALKDALGDEVPVWLYFDGNGYAKPSSLSSQEYVDMVKCQIYTAIIHGATGILFWNDWSKTPEVFETLLPVLEELNDNLSVVKLDTEQKTIDDDLHMVIKSGKKGEKYIMVSNTSKTETLSIGIHGVDKKELLPLEVYIASF
ncbi:hypothetical protein SAMN05444274_106179 [Mariniphaga anaerophila]|uniref:Uncharacterized protein n=1 Tax=Mariniphaga anaerophila TaxID=1484053 RepID=A0A1M5CLQ0_9BACT|nr:hypothetical protein [Mariniphaga anaerophila]SHF55658.1 hypothetical protein SAMN05444274_106179 [Mariniphaga anaerophila]